MAPVRIVIPVSFLFFVFVVFPSPFISAQSAGRIKFENAMVIGSQLERAFGAPLTAGQAEILVSAVGRAKDLSARELVQLASRERSLLFCLGLNAAFLLQVGGAACVNTVGEDYYMMNRGVGAHLGLAGELFAFIVNHEMGDRINTGFTAVTAGSTPSRPLWSLPTAQSFGALGRFLGPVFGVFYSLNSNQDGLMVGLRLGKIWQAGAVVNVDVFEDIAEMFEAVKRIRPEIFPSSPEDMRRRWTRP